MGNSYIAIDTETEIITPGVLAPRLVVLSYADKEGSGLKSKEQAPMFLYKLLEEGKTIVGHNIAFDLAVLATHSPALTGPIFTLYREGRVKDTQVREALMHIRKGTFTANRKKLSLNALAQKYFKEELDKGEDGWRLRYAELRDIALGNWPVRAKEYAIKDAEITYDVFTSQESSPDEDLQVRAAWALHLMSVHGVKTDGVAVERLAKELQDHIESLRSDLIAGGYIRQEKKKLVKDTKAIRARVVETMGDKSPRTKASERFPKGQVKIDAKTLQKVDDPILKTLVDYSETEKLLTTYVPVLRSGVEHSINARFNVIVETGRTSCSKPNLQNQPRKAGVRECYVPRNTNVYVACDYDIAELRALAQITFTWFGESRMRDAILEGRDLHLDLAAVLLGMDYAAVLEGKSKGDRKVKEARQFAKIANFGFPGGLGADAFVSYANGYGYNITRAFAGELRDAWFRRWPEMKPYFDRAGSVAGEFGSKRVKQFKSGRIRGGVRFTQAANSPFQGLVADGAKDALWLVTQKCYTEKSSPLFGCRPVVFVHDEIIAEAPEDRAAEMAEELSRVMNEGLQEWLPDVPVTSSAHLMRRWQKEAETVRDSTGRLKVWGE